MSSMSELDADLHVARQFADTQSLKQRLSVAALLGFIDGMVIGGTIKANPTLDRLTTAVREAFEP